MDINTGKVRNRWEILSDMINSFKLKNILELGVDCGTSSIPIYESCKDIIENYYLVDPVKHPNLDKIFIDPRCKFIQDYSKNAAQTFKDNSLDFIFIDACHDYASVLEDIVLWIPKIKIGGIISGHDFSDAHPGVIKAVNEKIRNFRLEVDYDRCGDHCVAVWWIFKE